ncbi:hypothetical protein BCV70DRAFT_4960 [Testicularia cyperi]|uniref:Uncharacterized protein n=1 Tax=Testicularia cyperi TaxID=1882483 RepID=A0A317XXU3_9BASI|nr:hypothetical protein BCV70DRAFT_4960 [Testicularia cyperi]
MCRESEMKSTGWCCLSRPRLYSLLLRLLLLLLLLLRVDSDAELDIRLRSSSSADELWVQRKR